MNADIINDKELKSIVTELLIRGRKLTFSMFLLHTHILKCRKMLD